MNNQKIGFSGILCLIFITLKLTEVITWSWWWVLSPIWGAIAFLLLMWGLFLLIYRFSSRNEKGDRVSNERRAPTLSKFQQRLADMEKKQIESRNQ